MRILAVNCGSSSLKFLLLALGERRAPGTSDQLASGHISGIGGHAQIRFMIGGHWENPSTTKVPDHAAAMQLALDWLNQPALLGSSRLEGIGHRIVHGGPWLFDPVVIDEQVMGQISAAAELAPLHNDAALSAIRAARQRLGETVPMVAVFDTAFHHDLPERAGRYAIPLDMAEKHGVRRYGFHGLAHRYMAERCAQAMGAPLSELRLITLQLGGGCSATAIEKGRSIDTSMGFTPLEGLMMGTRSGDIGPAVVRFLCGRTGMTVADAEHWLNHQAGLLGVSGRSADVRDLLEHEAQGDRRAALALEMFCYRLRKYIGAYLAALEGADAIVFGGGIGENAAEIRARTCRGMAWCGLELDEQRNRGTIRSAGEISADGSNVRAYVVPVDEETLIARDTYDCLASRNFHSGREPA